MENDRGSSSAAIRAREMLDLVDDANRETAERWRTPAWYHLALGAVSGAWCLIWRLPDDGRIWAQGVCFAVMFLIVALLIARNGSWVSGLRRGKTLWASAAAGLSMCVGLAVSYGVAEGGGPVWINGVIAIIVFVLVSAAGWLWDALYRRELIGPS